MESTEPRPDRPLRPDRHPAQYRPGENSERRVQPRRVDDRALQQAASLAECLEYVSDGVIVLDPRLRVVHMTHSARRLLETCKDYLKVQNQYLILAAADNARHLRQFAESVFSADEGCAGGGRIQDTFFIEHPPSEPLTASVFALHPSDPAAARLLLTLHDPRQRRGQNWQCFAQRFGLTPAELRLCMALTEDLCLADYSEQFHISPHTARSQLKRIFEKTGTHRQVQLLRLIFAFVQP